MPSTLQSTSKFIIFAFNFGSEYLFIFLVISLKLLYKFVSPHSVLGVSDYDFLSLILRVSVLFKDRSKKVRQITRLPETRISNGNLSYTNGSKYICLSAFECGEMINKICNPCT